MPAAHAQAVAGCQPWRMCILVMHASHCEAGSEFYSTCYTEILQAVCASASVLASYPVCKQAIRQHSMRLLCLCAVWGTSVWRRSDGGDRVH